MNEVTKTLNKKKMIEEANKIKPFNKVLLKKKINLLFNEISIEEFFIDSAKNMKTINMLCNDLNCTEEAIYELFDELPLTKQLYFSILKGSFEKAFFNGELKETTGNSAILLRVLDNFTNILPIEQSEQATIVNILGEVDEDDF